MERPKKIVDYVTVCETIGNDFDGVVKSFLDKGYELYGNPYPTSVEDGYSLHTQALTKKED